MSLTALLLCAFYLLGWIPVPAEWQPAASWVAWTALAVEAVAAAAALAAKWIERL